MEYIYYITGKSEDENADHLGSDRWIWRIKSLTKRQIGNKSLLNSLKSER